MVERYAGMLIRWRWPVLLLTLIWVIAAASGMRFLSFSSDYRIFFSKENPLLQAFEAQQNTYNKNDNVLFVVVPKSGNVFTPETLDVVEKLTADAWQTPFSIRVDSVTNFQHTYADGDDLVVRSLVEDAQSLTPAQLQRARQVALSEPTLVNRIISPSGHVTAVNVTVHLPEKNTQTEVPEVVKFARDLAARYKARYPDIDIRLTGIVFMNNAFPEAAQNDMRTLVPLMYVIILLLVGLSLRMVVGTFITLLVIMMAITSALGLAGWLGIVLSPPSSAAPIMLMTIAVAHCVHLLSNFQQGYGHFNDKRRAIMESLRLNMQPVFLTSLTTLIGFLSMNFSDAPPFRDLGNIVTMGVVTGWLLAITLLPVLVVILPLRRPKPRSDGWNAMERLGEFVVQKQRLLMWGMLSSVVVLVAFIPNNELNDEFVKYFDKSIQFRLDTDYTTDNLTGMYQISYSIPANGSGGINDPEYLRALEAFSQWYRKQPDVMYVNTFTDVMKRINKNMHNDKQEWYRIPGQRELAAQYLLLYEMSLPYGLDLNNQINVGKSATRLQVNLKSISTNELLALEQRAQEWLRKNAPPYMRTQGAGPSLMFANIGYSNIRSMLLGSVVALVLISFVLVFALRSLRIGVISLIPNLIPAAMAFGIWGIFVGQVGLSLSVVIGMTLGIVVDDTVHFLSKYLRARRERGLSSADAVRYAFSTVGMALWVTSVALMAGFLMLVLSSFELNSGMGLLTALTIGLALLADFLLLPPLLLKFDKGTSD